MLTRNKICYNLPESPYKVTIDRVTFYFSSMNHKEKFLEGYPTNVYNVHDSLKRRFKVSFSIPLLAGLILYSKIETRGFFITIGGEKIACLESVQLNGTLTSVHCSPNK